MRHATSFPLLSLLVLTASVSWAQDFPKIVVPEGFVVERVADSLHLPSSLAWDNEGRLYVAEAGGGLFPEQLAPIRILRVEDGATTVVADLSDDVKPSLVGIVWHDGAFYVTHRADDLTGAVSRVTLEGEVTPVFSGIIDSQAEHQINDVRVGPDGRMYVTVGPAGNAGVVDLSIAPWVMQSPGLQPRPCEDIVLTGQNFQTPDFRTPEPGDSALTGAYVPFGTETQPGQVIEGVTKCGGSILAFDPTDAEASLETVAWGFRNLIGIAWDPASGAMYGAENGYDVRGSRPVLDTIDASLRITDDVFWYGIPDFSAGRVPLTDPTFEPPDSLQVPVFVGGEPVGRTLDFVIDHEASGLTPPTPDVVLGQHPFNSSPSMIDVAPASWGELAGHAFIAEWGDLAPPTNPLASGPAGFRVVHVDPATGEVVPFVRNQMPGPASSQPPPGEPGIERPFDVQFGPDGALYIVDYGRVTIDFSQAPPYAYNENSGVIWRVRAAGGTSADGPAGAPGAFRLEASFPNPFGEAADIPFFLPEAAAVTLVVYDVLGREVERLVDERREAGRHHARFAGGRLASGVYLVRFEAGGVVETHRLTLVK